MKDVIFDFGGVLLDVNPERTRSSFEKAGVKNFQYHFSLLSQTEFFDRFEKGLLGEESFIREIQSLVKGGISAPEVICAWNAMLGGLDQREFDFLKEIRKTRRIFLLSNTNSIHEREFIRILDQGVGFHNFCSLFEKTYFSHHLRMRKPDREIFEKVISENRLDRNSLIFLDDSPIHIQGAENAGIKGILVSPGRKAGDYLSFLD